MKKSVGRKGKYVIYKDRSVDTFEHPQHHVDVLRNTVRKPHSGGKFSYVNGVLKITGKSGTTSLAPKPGDEEILKSHLGLTHAPEKKGQKMPRY